MEAHLSQNIRADVFDEHFSLNHLPLEDFPMLTITVTRSIFYMTSFNCTRFFPFCKSVVWHHYSTGYTCAASLDYVLNVSVKNLRSSFLPFLDFHMTKLTVKKWIFVSSPSTMRPVWHSLQTLLTTGTVVVVAVLAERNASFLSITVSITMWKHFEEKQFDLDFRSRNSARMICYRPYFKR